MSGEVYKLIVLSIRKLIDCNFYVVLEGQNYTCLNTRTTLKSRRQHHIFATNFNIHYFDMNDKLNCIDNETASHLAHQLGLLL